MNRQATILVVEDQPAERRALTSLLETEDYRVVSARGQREAEQLLKTDIDLVICDLRLGHASGVEVLRAFRKRLPLGPFVMVTAYGDVNSAVSAMKLGADDFLTKPIDPETLLETIGSLLAKRRLSPPVGEGEDEPLQVFGKMLAASANMHELFKLAERAAASTSTVLILGESGVGKELLAAGIHEFSDRRNRPFVAVNMAAVPEALVESELFGHVRGAFTGADADRVGRFIAAADGTLFIDEIGDLAPAAQAKLLRVLETRILAPVGSNDECTMDARVIAATSRDLVKCVAAKQFREDLYYRLNVVTLVIPPLRERRDDIRVLAPYFLRDIAGRFGKTMRLRDSLIDAMETLSWPGNVRQLRNAIESMVVLTDRDELSEDNLPPELLAELSEKHAAVPTLHGLDGLAQRAIFDALTRHGGNRTKAAAELRISVRTLQRKLKAWDSNDNANKI
jgi:DNA-binding NtrC family response regulator